MCSILRQISQLIEDNLTINAKARNLSFPLHMFSISYATCMIKIIISFYSSLIYHLIVIFQEVINCYNHFIPIFFCLSKFT